MGHVKSYRGNGVAALDSAEVIYVQKSSKSRVPAVAFRFGASEDWECEWKKENW